ncbi:hypothetical protein [Paenibacillus radicis (ex Xue et al. 2023)]|uniref:Uncharacterized protein n=1 Tax=Paenibacillus radicis (ex Xue et al. 2023) TaxID=2972489 RepID=A0ABT1YD03_9BACL|nr:hypothetical protein [Paenibacillus radicis (ex Xue et al. 2023)]MCR8631061.1 hypothetical protein [Paenibacillus radicis (ex Xue et al. 2023)]
MSSGERNIMTREGFYTKAGNDRIGVYLSSEGPRLFINSEVFELQNHCWDLEMVMGKSSHLVTFYWQGEVKLSTRCSNENEMFLSLYHYLSCRIEAKRLA